MFFAGKVQKITSVVAGIATAAFIRELIKDADWNNAHPNWIDRLPHFDARVLQVPNRTEAANMFLWREADARKNAITMVASSIYSHKELQGKSGKDKLAMIAEKGMVFDHFPASLRQGAFMRRVVRDVAIPEEQRLSIPERHRPEAGTMVPRSNIEVIDMPQFNLVFNRNEVIFDGAEPLLV